MISDIEKLLNRLYVTVQHERIKDLEVTKLLAYELCQTKRIQNGGVSKKLLDIELLCDRKIEEANIIIRSMS